MKKKIFFNKTNSTNIPWIESPLFYEILKELRTRKEFINKAIDMHEKGYCIIDLNLDKKFIEKINSDIDKEINKGTVKKNPSIYHYNKFPRIVEAWKFSKNVGLLALNKKIFEFLSFFYKKKPIAFSTLNFIRGTEQPLHSDYMHFATTPHKFLAGVWVALEDTNKFNGPISLVPGSHKFDIIDFNTLNCSLPDSLDSLEKNYRLYENYIKELVASKKYKIKQIHIKKGQAIIWAANLLHGGTKMINKNKTRKSQVMHYHFHGCIKYYNPGFSDPNRGIFKERILEKIKV